MRARSKRPQEHRPAVDREAPTAGPDVPFQLPERECVLDAGRLRAARGAGDHPGAIHRLLTKAPGFPAPRAGQGELHRHGLLSPAGQPHLAMQAQGCRRSILAGGGDHDLDLPLHLAPVEIAQPGLDFQPSVAGFETRLETHPLDRDRTDVLELDRAPQPDRHLPAIWVGNARIRRCWIRLQLSVVEDTHDVPLYVGLGLDRRFATDDEQVLVLQVGREVETERSEVSVMRTEQLAVEPCVGGEKRAADAEEDASGMVGSLKLRAIPNRLPVPVGRELARNFDRLPAHASAEVETFGFALAEGHPHRLPAAQLTDAPGPLWQWEEKAVAQRAFT